MTIFFKNGESIQGGRLYYCFGTKSFNSKNRRVRGKLGRNGYAKVDRPLKRSTILQSRELDKIDCKSAIAECDSVSEERQKVHHGSHRCFAGWLEGQAVATIEVPKQAHL